MSDSDRRNGGRDGPGTGVVVKSRTKTRKPAMYKVLMLNDDYTPMEFVVHVLERFFQKTRDEATRIMLHVHRRGVGVCGVFTYEVAENQSDPGYGPCPAEPAPTPMHHRKRVTLSKSVMRLRKLLVQDIPSIGPLGFGKCLRRR